MINSIGLKKLPLNFLISLGVSVTINSLLYFIGNYFKFVPNQIFIGQDSTSFNLTAVILATLTGAFIGLVFLLVIRFLSPDRAYTTFNYIVLTGLMLSFFTPFALNSASIAFICLLEMMHVTSVASMIFIMARRSRG